MTGDPAARESCCGGACQVPSAAVLTDVRESESHWASPGHSHLRSHPILGVMVAVMSVCRDPSLASRSA